jgi:organic radical activating enzyme
MRENNLNIQVFSSCNCSCKFCNFTDKCYNKIDSTFVLNYINEHPNINYILLTGGEPTLAIEECSEIIKGLNSNEKTIVLQTNGWWGNNEKIKEQLLINPPSCVHLSVDYEKQKIIPIETVVNAYNFLVDNNIEVIVINHYEHEEEFLAYQKIIPSVERGYICYKTDDNEYDCGIALLATNEIGKLNIDGWRN